MLIYYILTVYSNIKAKDDIFGNMCRQLIEKFHQLKEFSIKEIAELCSVSLSTVSRFPRILAYRNLNDMTASMYLMTTDYQNNGQFIQAPCDTLGACYESSHLQMIQMVEEIYTNIPLDLLEEASGLLNNAQKVCISGSPIPQSAYSLQMELSQRGIKATAYMNPDDQYHEIESLNDQDVLLVFDGIAYESITRDLLLQKPEKTKLIIVSPYAFKKKAYNADCFIYFRNINFTMNLFTTSVITNHLLTFLQQK